MNNYIVFALCRLNSLEVLLFLNIIIVADNVLNALLNQDNSLNL